MALHPSVRFFSMELRHVSSRRLLLPQHILLLVFLGCASSQGSQYGSCSAVDGSPSASFDLRLSCNLGASCSLSAAPGRGLPIRLSLAFDFGLSFGLGPTFAETVPFGSCLPVVLFTLFTKGPQLVPQCV